LADSPIIGRHPRLGRDNNVPPKQAHRPEIGEDLVFQHHNWRVQRVGWALLAVLIVAGLVGLLGPGPLSNVNARGGNGLEVEYERFVRHGAQTELRVRVTQPPSGQVRIAISREYLDTLNLQQVVPAPTRVQASGVDVVYTFELAGNGPMQATFVLQPEKLGKHVARVAIDIGTRVTVQQFTYP
jgi:hypothetical protein